MSAQSRVTLHTAVGKNRLTFFPFNDEACSLYLVLWLCALAITFFLYRCVPCVFLQDWYQVWGSGRLCVLPAPEERLRHQHPAWENRGHHRSGCACRGGTGPSRGEVLSVISKAVTFNIYSFECVNYFSLFLIWLVFYVYPKDYCITGRANPIFCAVCLR